MGMSSRSCWRDPVYDSRNAKQRGHLPMTSVRLMTLNPGHFHAALVQKEMVPDVDPRVDVYAPLGPDLTQHLTRLAGFNTRATNPTDWRAEVHTGPDWLERALREKPGNVAILAGFNRDK